MSDRAPGWAAGTDVMAKKAKKPAAEGDAAPEGAAGGGKKKLIAIAAAALLLGGGGGWFLLKKKAPDQQVAEVKKPVAFVDVADIVLNLALEAPGDKPRFLRVKIALEVKDAKVVSEVQPLMPRVLDIFQVFMRELRPSDIEGSGGIHRLREELLRRVNLAVFPTKVDAVLFKELVLQ
jgi:flagellar FliL protein